MQITLNPQISSTSVSLSLQGEDETGAFATAVAALEALQLAEPEWKAGSRGAFVPADARSEDQDTDLSKEVTALAGVTQFQQSLSDASVQAPAQAFENIVNSIMGADASEGSFALPAARSGGETSGLSARAFGKQDVVREQKSTVGGGATALQPYAELSVLKLGQAGSVFEMGGGPVQAKPHSSEELQAATVWIAPKTSLSGGALAGKRGIPDGRGGGSGADIEALSSPDFAKVPSHSDLPSSAAPLSRFQLTEIGAQPARPTVVPTPGSQIALSPQAQNQGVYAASADADRQNLYSSQAVTRASLLQVPNSLLSAPPHVDADMPNPHATFPGTTASSPIGLAPRVASQALNDAQFGMSGQGTERQPLQGDGGRHAVNAHLPSLAYQSAIKNADLSEMTQTGLQTAKPESVALPAAVAADLAHQRDPTVVSRAWDDARQPALRADFFFDASPAVSESVALHSASLLKRPISVSGVQTADTALLNSKTLTSHSDSAMSHAEPRAAPLEGRKHASLPHQPVQKMQVTTGGIGQEDGLGDPIHMAADAKDIGQSILHSLRDSATQVPLSPVLMTLPFHAAPGSPFAHPVSQLILKAAHPDCLRTVELSLSPEELGKLRFDIVAHGDRLSVMVFAERPEALDLLRRHGDQLLQELRLAGFTQSSLNFGDWSQRSGRSTASSQGALQALPDPTPVETSLSAASSLRSTAAGRLDLRL
ncbi:flagellar hook-length control protein FliK [Pseudorhodobacter sp. MZDSW-24AT]|uniref:flagellar hook-length control protein FliK n=1 Tax=Pseudorhodobacter sp. MZDSW-24AT TaxID=2052957 RepID=UPI000C1EDD85|nr:flagellar hook-length control protein FliK [Pseudorhodobacter sp. MZDSW-24AT]PJF09889.1 hypothetical protein CUR21_08370 [Pseudorhodobacter sp. MZDSW-24AT]